MTTTKQPESVSSVLKTFGILQALSTQKDIGISELAQRLMMSKSTVYRFLQTMKTLGYVSQEGESENYSLTLKLFELGASALEYVDLVDLADIEMRRISDLTNEALHLGALDGDGIIYIHKIDSKYNLRMQSRIDVAIRFTPPLSVKCCWLSETSRTFDISFQLLSSPSRPTRPTKMWNPYLVNYQL